MTGKPARILIIAGSDSSGGAGIQADIKTATALGAYAMTAITAVTVQDTTEVRAICPVPPRIVREQILACLNDIGADAIKTGMLGSAEMVEAVADALAKHAKGIPLVVDPVMASTSGTEFLDDDAIAVLKTRLIPLAALVTPNSAEFKRMADYVSPPGPFQTRSYSMTTPVLLKGGHSENTNESVDTLLQGMESRTFASPRLDTTSTHGTGCTLATAIACGLGEGLSLEDSIARAHAYVHEAIRTAPGFGHGHGPLNHMHSLK